MELQALQQECLACRRCGLCETRHSVVFGQGAAHAEVMLVGEGPGRRRTATRCRKNPPRACLGCASNFS